MAKIDVSLIEGYEEMTPEQKLVALEAYDFDTSELEQLRQENQKSKSLIDKYASEIASLKKAKNSELTEAEQKAQAREDALAELQGKYDEILKESTRSKYTAKYIELGYDKALAEETAQAVVDGDMEKVFANGEKYRDSLEKKLKAEAMKGTPKPFDKGGAKYTSKEEIMKIQDAADRQRAIAENIELFRNE